MILLFLMIFCLFQDPCHTQKAGFGSVLYVQGPFFEVLVDWDHVLFFSLDTFFRQVQRTFVNLVFLKSFGPFTRRFCLRHPNVKVVKRGKDRAARLSHLREHIRYRMAPKCFIFGLKRSLHPVDLYNSSYP